MPIAQVSAPARAFGARAGWWSRRRWRRRAARITRRCSMLAGLSDAELEGGGQELRWRMLEGENPIRHLVEAYALVREAARRACGQVHRPVQLLGGIALFEGTIVEMQTGEGKTLTAFLPVFLHALSGRGAHVITANEYLAERDARLARSVLQRLGLSIGCVLPSMGADERRRQYECDVTYGTAREMGFDFLRDRLKSGDAFREGGTPSGGGTANGEPLVQRGHYFALVDEADSVLIDDARTPLLIALQEPPDPAERGLYRWAARNAALLEPGRDFVFSASSRDAVLSRAGCRRILSLPIPALLQSIDTERVLRQMEWALSARLGFHADRDYVITNARVEIVDQSTGRTLDGRKWQEGLHQSIEAKEGLPITQGTRTAARITTQRYFRSYSHLAGMTGTARPAAREFRKVYGLPIACIPTHRPCRRRPLRPRIFATLDAKLQAVADEAARMRQEGRAVLIGTPSIRASERLSQVLHGRSVPHQVLNCRFHAAEAEVIAQAGQAGQVTVATNMAGRGTDIQVAPEVLRRGGLHVIATEMHASARIDRQLIGRTGRQGEPGTFRLMLSLQDEIFGLLSQRAHTLFRHRTGTELRGELPRRWLRVFRGIQRKLERLNSRQRWQLLRYEQEHRKACEAAGLDPLLDIAD